MKPLVLAVIMAASAAPTYAALPPDAYTGSFFDRLTRPVTCVPYTIKNNQLLVLPEIIFGSGHAKPGSYIWYNMTTGKCEQGGV